MSYDFGMIEVVSNKPVEVDDCDLNYTYNVAPMFADALGFGITNLNDKSGIDILPLLNAAIKKMKANPDKYIAMNPSNGWGDYDGALDILITLKGWCEKYPNALLCIT